MTDHKVSAGRRLHLKAAGAGALGALLAACGGGGGSAGAGTSPIGSNGGGNGGGAQPTGSITLLAGDPVAAGYVDGAGAAARFSSPRGLALDAAGNLYVADQSNQLIRKITPDGRVSTFAGAPGSANSANGNTADARFIEPLALALDSAGNLFVADQFTIRKITPAGVVSTAAIVDPGPSVSGRNATLFEVGGIAVDSAGNLYATNGIGTRRIAPSGAFTMLEGVATKDVGFNTNGASPRGITVDAGGTVWLVTLDNTIARVDAGDKLVTVAGTPGQSGAADGSGAAASFAQVVALAPDRGNLVAADILDSVTPHKSTIRRITPNGVVTTVAGTAGSGVLQTGALPGAFADLGGVVADGKGNLYASSGNAIVKIVLP